jgi:hypothetical protein
MRSPNEPRSKADEKALQALRQSDSAPSAILHRLWNRGRFK